MVLEAKPQNTILETQGTRVKSHIKGTDPALIQKGINRIEWAEAEMPVLRQIRERFEREQPLKGLRLSACLHVTAETANLMRTLKAGGADLTLCGSNPLSTQDDVAAALVEEYGISTFAVTGEDTNTYYSHIVSALDHRPQITMDDGADLVSSMLFIALDRLDDVHPTVAQWAGNLGADERHALLNDVVGSSEETTTGVIRLKAMEKDGVLKFPVIAVNESDTKHLFDNRYGTGQSTVDGILRATNILLPGKIMVICGYGWCGRGIALRARGMGARVVVTEVQPVRALEAVMEGYEVMPLVEAAKVGDIFVTVTGDLNVIDRQHMEVMKNGAIMCNSGHFNDEINIPALVDLGGGKRGKIVRDFVEEFVMADGRKLYLLADGRLVNLAAAEGHPASVMDMSFANQALAAEYMVVNGPNLEPKVYVIPQELDHEIAMLKLLSLGIQIDELTEEQKNYLASWESGT
ncbi:MAG TPA: adenosylhomocysteinase [Chloroflexia bacterium]|nr:adenosylhomocysteinase [Chloroflexia bacterium]